MGLVHDLLIEPLGRVSFLYWGMVFFVFGCVVGSFLNVCIYRMPRGESIVSPPSHCPNCNWKIPWYFNIPILSWIILRGKCYNCGTRISPRYLIVEATTGILFAVCWFKFGATQPLLALIFAVFIAGLIAASFIDFEHYIIPDEITIGGIVVGILISIFYPTLHGVDSSAKSFLQSVIGVVVGGGLIFIIVQVGKLIFGRYKIRLGGSSRIIFTDDAMVILKKKEASSDESEGETMNRAEEGVCPVKDTQSASFSFRESDSECREVIPYDEIFSRESDTIVINAQTVELHDRCFWNVEVRLSPKTLKIGNEELNPETINFMEITAENIIIPREAMGFGDVKYMAGIGAFLGWQGVLFSLCASSIIGAVLGALILLFSGGRSTRIPYGPFISIAALIWVFFKDEILKLWLL